MSNDFQGRYKFKRDFYYDINEKLKVTNAVFLLGPRKCGKTVAMLQLSDNRANAEYFDFKAHSADESMDIIATVEAAVKNREDKIFLLDEITYAHYPENEIAKIALAYAETENPITKVVFAGSQSVALESWGARSFAGNAEYVRADFLTYPEWLRYSGIETASEETYRDFLYNVDKLANRN